MRWERSGPSLEDVARNLCCTYAVAQAQNGIWGSSNPIHEQSCRVSRYLTAILRYLTAVKKT